MNDKKTKKTAIITFLSERNPKAKNEEYSVDVKGEDGQYVKKIVGKYTNDAPIKYLLDKARDEGNVVDKILCILSEKVYSEYKDKPEAERQDSAIGYFCDMVDKHAWYFDELEFEKIPYDYREMSVPVADDSTEMKKVLEIIGTQEEKISEVCEKILNSLKEYDQVYIDYTGGLRDITFFTTILIRYLEFINIECKDIVYSNYQEKKIYSLLSIYRVFRLLNAVSQFVETGNGKLLNDIYDVSEDKKTKNLAKVLNEFSQAIQLCDMRNIDSVIEELIKAIEDLEEKSVHKTNIGESDDSADILVKMFPQLLSIIKKKFYIDDEMVSDISDKNDNREKKLSYPKLIKWCLDNNLIQQALTLYEAKIPEIYYDKYLIVSDEGNQQTTSKNSGMIRTKEEEYFYTTLYEKIGCEILEEKIFLQRIKDILSKGIEVIKEGKEDKNNGDEVRYTLTVIYDFLNEYYDLGKSGDDTRKSKNCTEMIIKYEGVDNRELEIHLNQIGKTVTSCLNIIMQNQGILLSIGEKKEYVKSKATSTNEGKIQILEEMEKGKNDEKINKYSNIKKKDLIAIMQYYLAVKFMRNNINHASNSELSDDQILLIQYMEGLGICMDMSFTNIRKLISDGLRITNSELFDAADDELDNKHDCAYKKIKLDKIYQSKECDSLEFIELCLDTIASNMDIGGTAAYYVGKHYAEGNGIVKDIDKAISWFEESSKRGCIESMIWLGDFFYSNEERKSGENALVWYKRAAQEGDENHYFRIAYILGNGPEHVKNQQEAVMYYRKAVAQDDRVAMYNLGKRYQNGNGVEQNIDEAIKLLEQAANKDYEDAKKALAEIYQGV